MQNPNTAAFWLIILLTISPTCLAEISLSSNTDVSSEGYFVLSWESDSQAPLTLQQSRTDNFVTVKETGLLANGSITVTGLLDGQYFYRVVDANAQQSNVVPVTVAHHSLARAFGFFSLGLVLFIVLVTTIIIGRKREPTL